LVEHFQVTFQVMFAYEYIQSRALAVVLRF